MQRNQHTVDVVYIHYTGIIYIILFICNIFMNKEAQNTNNIHQSFIIFKTSSQRESLYLEFVLTEII